MACRQWTTLHTVRGDSSAHVGAGKCVPQGRRGGRGGTRRPAGGSHHAAARDARRVGSHAGLRGGGTTRAGDPMGQQTRSTVHARSSFGEFAGRSAECQRCRVSLLSLSYIAESASPMRCWDALPGRAIRAGSNPPAHRGLPCTPQRDCRPPPPSGRRALSYYPSRAMPRDVAPCGAVCRCKWKGWVMAARQTGR